MNWTKYHSSILTIAIIALLHQFAQKLMHWQLPYLHAYFDDVLCVPLFLAVWRWERNRLWRVARVSTQEIIIFVLIVFVFFEGIVPRYSPHFTADWWDGLAYLAGGFLFWAVQPDETDQRPSDEPSMATKTPSNHG